METKRPRLRENTLAPASPAPRKPSHVAGTGRPARQRTTADHEFGSNATDLKLRLVEAYSRAYTKALCGKFPELLYLDAFAGTGERTERVPAHRLLNTEISERIVRHRGSAAIAIDVQPPFDKLVFIERRPRAVAALQHLRDRHPDRNIEVIAGDSNLEIPNLISSINWRRARALMFLDPYGMNVDWQTLAAVAATRAIDVWFLFSLSGLYRQAARRADAIDENKRSALTRVLGTSAWEKELYRRQSSFFPEHAPLRRTTDARGLEKYVRDRLLTIFPAVLEPFPLPVDRRPQRFSLFFALSNSNPTAIALATRIANHILRAGMSSQWRPRY